MNGRQVARVMLLAAAAAPARLVDDGPVTCVVRRLTGRPCPACGLTRSWRAAAHGRPRESLTHHPFGLVTMVGAAWFAADPGAEDRVARLDRRLLTLAIGAWLATWLWRLRRA
jgi:hypothetical protein